MRNPSSLKGIAAIFVLTVSMVSVIAGQDRGQVRVQVFAGNQAVEDAEVVVSKITARTDAAGVVAIRVLPGDTYVTVIVEGFLPVKGKERKEGK